MSPLEAAAGGGEAQTRELIKRIAGDLPIDAFCELVAETFGIGPRSGEQTIEMNFNDGAFNWARVHSGRIGRDALERLRAHPDEG